MATAFGADDPFVIEQKRAQENLQQAQELKKYRPVQGPGMVSGIYVKSNPLQHLAELLRTYTGVEKEKEAQKQLTDISGRRNTAVTDALRGYTTNMMGAPASEAPKEMFVADDAGGGEMTMGTQVTPAVAPNPLAAYQSLMNAPDAAMRAQGMTGMMTMQQKQAAEQQAQAQQARQMQLLQSAKTPQAALQAGVPYEMVKNYYESRNLGRDEVKFEDVGGQKVPVTKYGDTPQGVQPLTKTGNPFSDLVVRDAAGNIVPNAPLASVKTGIAKAGATNVDARNFNTQESEQSKSYGKTLGDIRGQITQAGYDAPKKLAQIDRMEQLLAGVEGGKLAPLGLDIASAAESFGIKIDPKLGNKEASEALAIEMALMMHKPGTGPMTDPDMVNYMKTVPGLAKTPEGRANISKTMRAAIQRDQEAAKFARDYAKQNKGVIDDNFFDAMANFYAERPVVNIPMPATNARGSQFRVVR